MYTTHQVAAKLGLARRTVQKWAAVLGFERQGRDYLLTDEQVAQLAAVTPGKPGRPRKQC